MAELLKIFIKAALIDNVILVQYLAPTFVIILATIVTYPIYYGILVKFHVEFLQTLIFILVIAALVQLVEFYLKKTAPTLYSSMGVYLALITTNCAVLAVTLNCISKNYNYLESIVYALGTAGGFILSMVIMSGLRQRLLAPKVPAVLKGKPILFITAGLLSMSFMGFAGMIK